MRPGVSRLGLPAIILAATITGCASLPEGVQRMPSHALPDPETTVIGREMAEAARRHPGMSGFALVRSGRVAFTARISMADAAEKTLDLQYYIWEGDATGLILVDRVIQAADRGVRVRLLVDDINLGSDDALAAVDHHPNIQIRIFNPFTNRRLKGLGFVTDLGRVNHRMHNKVMIVDGALAIAGGRNIGNHYFGVDTSANFRDLDMLAAGPIVPEISETFDYFWNGEWSYPVAALVDRPATDEDLASQREKLADFLATASYPYSLEQDIKALSDAVDEESLTWAPGAVVVDDPASLARMDELGTGEVSAALGGKIRSIERELLIESAYFVPTKPGIEATRELVGRGVRIRVLTNSLASNDVLAAHAGYEKRRKGLLEAGVELYELRPDSLQPVVDQSVVSAGSAAALHTKAFVFDRESVFVGSFNLDPRSANINTEFGLYVESPELAQELAAFMDEGVSPESAYRVVLNDRGRVRWIETGPDGSEVRYDTEPQSGFWQRFTADILKLLPIESQL